MLLSYDGDMSQLTEMAMMAVVECSADSGHCSRSCWFTLVCFFCLCFAFFKYRRGLFVTGLNSGKSEVEEL